MSDGQAMPAADDNGPATTSAGEDDNPETSATGTASDEFEATAASAPEHSEYAEGKGEMTEADVENSAQAWHSDGSDGSEPGDAADTAEYSGGGQPAEPVGQPEE